MPDYLFVTLKPLHIVDGEIAESPLHAFVGRDFCITISDLECPAGPRGDGTRLAGRLRYRLQRKFSI